MKTPCARVPGGSLTGWTVAVTAVLALGTLVAAPAWAQPVSGSDCTEWQDCRQATNAAIDRGDYETAHDLAWRAVQTGPPRDPALMYLLARAQSLSGRPHDALIMLRRLAEMGVAVEAGIADFRRTRDLPGWPEVEALLARVATYATNRSDPSTISSSAPSAPSAPAAPPASSEPGASAPVSGLSDGPPAEVPAPDAASPASPTPSEVERMPVALAAVEEAVRFSSGSFSPGGLAYDAVSDRFVFGDLSGRKLMIVSEGTSHSVDLVRADSAGFHAVMAIEIDTRRGDLWVASAEKGGGAGILHKLQLISGRALTKFEVPADLEPVRLTDLAVTSSGAVLVLESEHGRVLILRPGASHLEVLLDLEADSPVSLTTGSREGVAYVAHGDGLSRLDLSTGTAAPVEVPEGIDVGRIERIRRHDKALVGIQASTDGSRRIVRLDLNATGRAITGATIVAAAIPDSAGPTFATVSGDELSYLVGDASGTAGSDQVWTVHRIQLR